MVPINPFRTLYHIRCETMYSHMIYHLSMFECKRTQSLKYIYIFNTYSNENLNMEYSTLNHNLHMCINQKFKQEIVNVENHF